MRDQLRTVCRGHSLTEDEAQSAFGSIMRGEQPPARIAGLAMAMAARGETVDEIVGMATTARSLALPVPFEGDVLDVCGTGGDGHNTFNISTATALVVAACEVPVAKHGNRSVSSNCGSADVLEELGVRIDSEPREAAHCLREIGITFLFAPVFHPTFGRVSSIRRELGVPTVFNLLGPLCNPAGARYQTLGVPRPDLVRPMAEVLARLGVHRVMVFHAEDGMDELSLGAPSRVVEIREGSCSEYRLSPTELGLSPAHASRLAGGDRGLNAEIIRRVLAGDPGPARDVVLLNAAAGLRAAGRAEDWHEGTALASRAIDSGAASALLTRWIEVSREQPQPMRNTV
ncbi:anthranilate phosphoribosyltransferase [Actinopolyspora erythraea]|uniref:Anthranilate phosphoribosyltransferase n=1 Tax=Actinopolyspora erythraea TaxID=414996 RepID=A0A099DA38_9ACTN|nr:anthranilate phosphoribosyltransferase [Actinopolyspora erythraea]ASU80281.1 anthranilate phosphoribosyltransferase [Actinopolyspora erythraea]KGI82637.1 anthranilate phosphoribosyltransferase [Actinopolyspora erythraea]